MCAVVLLLGGAGFAAVASLFGSGRPELGALGVSLLLLLGTAAAYRKRGG